MSGERILILDALVDYLDTRERGGGIRSGLQLFEFDETLDTESEYLIGVAHCLSVGNDWSDEGSPAVFDAIDSVGHRGDCGIVSDDDYGELAV